MERSSPPYGVDRDDLSNLNRCQTGWLGSAIDLQSKIWSTNRLKLQTHGLQSKITGFVRMIDEKQI